MDERVLAERLITYDTSTLDGLRAAAGFVKGWLESRELERCDEGTEAYRVAQRDKRRAEAFLRLAQGGGER